MVVLLFWRNQGKMKEKKSSQIAKQSKGDHQWSTNVPFPVGTHHDALLFDERTNCLCRKITGLPSSFVVVVLPSRSLCCFVVVELLLFFSLANGFVFGCCFLFFGEGAFLKKELVPSPPSSAVRWYGTQWRECLPTLAFFSSLALDFKQWLRVVVVCLWKMKLKCWFR